MFPLAMYGYKAPSGELTALAYQKIALQLSEFVDSRMDDISDKHFDLCKSLLSSSEVNLFDKTVSRIDEAILVLNHIHDDDDWAIDQKYFKKSTTCDKLGVTKKYKDLIRSIDEFGNDALRLLDLDGENRMAANQIIADWFEIKVSNCLIIHNKKGLSLIEGMRPFAEYFNIEQHKAICVEEIQEKFADKHSNMFDKVDEMLLVNSGINVDSITVNIS